MNTRPLFESLESRLLMSGTEVFTDVDNDVATLQLIGPGHMVIVEDANGLAAIELTGTKGTSSLQIAVKKKVGGDGLLKVGMINILGTGGLKNLGASDVDLTGGGITSDGRVAFISVNTVGVDSGIRIAQNVPPLTRARTTYIVADYILNGAVIDSGEGISNLESVRIGDATISAPSIGNLLSKGYCLADITTDSIWTARVGGATDGAWTIDGDGTTSSIQLGHTDDTWSIDAPDVTVSSLRVNGAMNYESIDLLAIGTLQVFGDMVGTGDLTLRYQPLPQIGGQVRRALPALRSASVDGAITGTWAMDDAGPISAGSASEWIVTAGDVRSIHIANNAMVSWTGRSIGTLYVGGSLGLSMIELSAPTSAKTYALKSAVIEGEMFAYIIADGNIGSVTAGKFYFATIFAGTVPDLITMDASTDAHHYFTNDQTRIEYVRSTGMEGETNFVEGLDVLAPNVGTVRLWNLTPTNQGVDGIGFLTYGSIMLQQGGSLQHPGQSASWPTTWPNNLANFQIVDMTW